jgi:hypothetical protein
VAGDLIEQLAVFCVPNVDFPVLVGSCEFQLNLVVREGQDLPLGNGYLCFRVSPFDLHDAIEVPYPCGAIFSEGDELAEAVVEIETDDFGFVAVK